MDAFDIPDSSDWLGTPLEALTPVEQAFRCHVCKDFLNSPVLTSCNHSFCSLCIRRCLAVNGQCPLCKKGDQESKLRVNCSLREAVDAFAKSREALLSFAKSVATSTAAQGNPEGGAGGPGPEEPRTVVIESTAGMGETTRPRPRSSSSGRTRSSVKRKVVDLTGDSANDSAGEEKRTRISTRASKAKAVEATAVMMREMGNSVSNHGPYYPDDGLVACPICDARMKEAQVSTHMDTTCPGIKRPTKKSPTPISQSSQQPMPQMRLVVPPSPAKKLAASPSSRPAPITMATRSHHLPQQQGPANVPDRLPPLNYSMLNDSALRKKMTALGLSTYGSSRQALERRHQEWVTLWNANCDSAYPKTQSALMRDLDEWERAMRNRGGGGQRLALGLGGAGGGVGDGGATPRIREKDFDGVGWVAKNESLFADLIADARRTARLAARDKPRAAKEEDKGSSGDDHERSAAGQNGEEAKEEVKEAGLATELMAPSGELT